MLRVGVRGSPGAHFGLARRSVWSFWERFVGTQSPFGAPVFGLRRLKCFSDNPELSFSSSYASERSLMKLWKDNLYQFNLAVTPAANNSVLRGRRQWAQAHSVRRPRQGRGVWVEGKCEINKVRIIKFEKTSLGTGGWASRGVRLEPRSWAYSGLLGIENP